MGGEREIAVVRGPSLTCLSDLILRDSHNIWLRDHCRCPECFHPVTKQRLLDTFGVSSHTSLLDLPPVDCRFADNDPRLLQIPVDIVPLSVESKSHGLEVTCGALYTLLTRVRRFN